MKTLTTPPLHFYLIVQIFFLVPLLYAAPEETTEDLSSDPLATFFEESETYATFRYRFENVDQAGFKKDANASTLRSVLGFKSAEVYRLNGHIEIEDVSELGPDTFNNTINGVTDRPVVADVDGTEVNILTLTSSHISDSKLLAGRYHKVLDNARFVGDVVWRQNHQTFDGATFTNTTLEDVEFFYGYMWNVNRIFGDDSPVGDIDSANHLFHVNYSGLKDSTISLYSYLLDLEDLSAQSSATFGGLATGKQPLGDNFSLLYDLEYAYQSDYQDNPANYHANYLRAGTGIGYKAFSLSGGFELLGSDSGKIAFSTPLATLHKWNGWADIFLNTPPEGLQDSYGKLAYVQNEWSKNLGKTVLEFVYHHFQSEEGNITYGREWDVNIVQHFYERYYAGVKFAHYDAQSYAQNTTKLIFSLGANFSTAG